MRVIILGGGIIGVSSAYYLARDGHDVTVIDRNNGTALETSFANGGMLTPSQAAPWNSPGIACKILKWLGQRGSPLRVNPLVVIGQLNWARDFLYYSARERYLSSMRKNAQLADYSLDLLHELAGRHAIAYDQSARGTIKIYRNLEELELAIQLLRSVDDMHINYRVLDREGLTELEPTLDPQAVGIAGGIYYPDDESGDAHKFTRILTAEARDLGARFEYETSITGLVRQGNNLARIETDKGDLEADLYVLAAGSYSPILSRAVGLRLPIRPVKGYSLTFETSAVDPVPSRPVIDETRHLALTPLGRRLRISGSAEIAGYSRDIRPSRVNMMLDFLKELYPGLPMADVGREYLTWAGLRPYCSDGVPIIGRCELDNLCLNTGHGHLGWTLSLGSSALLADIIATCKTRLDPQCYSINRFNKS